MSFHIFKIEHFKVCLFVEGLFIKIKGLRIEKQPGVSIKLKLKKGKKKKKLGDRISKGRVL
jgi:hypothetical protein